MNLYLVEGRYLGTQAEARAACKEHGIKFDADFHAESVPTDKEGLIAYLNRVSAQAPAGDQFTSVVERVDPPMNTTQRPTAEGARALAQGADKDAVVEFIQGAPIWALGDIFGAATSRVQALTQYAENTIKRAETVPATQPLDDLMG